jgi:hypothetical protein
MSEREADDTPKPGGPPQPESGTPSDTPPGSYYYDDATGYEVYNPEADEEEEDEDGDGSDE